MPKKGIHPMLYQMTVVLRNGASIQMPTTIPRSTPLFLREDPTNHPLWTGKDSGMSAEDGRMAKFLSKYEGFTNIGLAPATGKKTGSSETADGVAGKGNQ